MSCFDVQILDPNINTIEIETCIGDQPSSIDIVTYDNISTVEINHCIALLPSEINELITVQDILAGSGISISDSSGIYTISLLDPTISATGILDLLETVQDIIGNSGLLAGSFININYNDATGYTTVSATGLQPSGNYSVDGHTHTSSNITDFNSSVSGLLPVKNINAGSGIGISSVSGDFIVSVTGTFGLTSEEVDDRISNLLVAGNYINLNYNDLGNSLTISVTGVQPSGNYSLVGHSHNTSDITNFDSGVSGLLPSVSGSGYIVSSFTNNIYTISVTGLQPSGNYSVVGHTHLSSDITNFDSAVSGLIPPSNFTSLTGISGIVVTNSGTNYFVGLNDPTIQLADITDLTSAAQTFLLTSSSTNLSSLMIDKTGSGVLVFNTSPAFSGIPTAPTASSGTNTDQIASTAFVRNEISNLVDSAPITLDTLNELAAALGDDPNFATTITNTLAGKASLSGAIFTGPVTIPSGAGNFNSLTVNGVNVSVSGHTHLSTDITDSTSFGRNILTASSYAAQNKLSWQIVGNSITAAAGGQYIIPTNATVPSTLTITDPSSPSHGDWYVVIKPSGAGGGIGGTVIGGTTYSSASGLYLYRIYSADSIFSSSWKTYTLDKLHYHTSSDIINFNSGVSGLLPSISGSGYISSSFADNTYILSVTGLQPSGNYSLVGHTHISSNITDFNNAVSGLITVKNIVGGSGIDISSLSGTYTVSVTGISGLISEEVDDRVSSLLIAGTGVNLIYNDASGTLTIDNLHSEINVLSQEPQGFVNRTDSLITFNDSSRTFTIQPAVSGGYYSIYAEGIKVIKSGIETVVLGSGTALNYIHFDTTPPYALHTKTTGFNFDTDIPIAFIHWNSDINQSTFFGEERHGIRMDSVTHKWIHNTFGMQYISGLSIGGYVLLGDGSSNSHAQIDISDGVLYQEDIIINITDDNGTNSANEFVQPLSPIAYIPVYYHSGQTGQWVRDAATTFPLKYNATRAQYNLYSGGTWTTPNVPNNKYFAMWIVATNDMNDPILSIMGQREDSSLTAAESNNNWGNINLTNIPTQELRPLYRLIFVTNDTFTNTPKSSLQSILDIRTSIQSVSAGVTQNDHGSLFGLVDDDHPQYVHIDNARTIDAIHTFTNGLNASGLINAASGNFTSLTVNSTGVSLVGHTHTSSDITNFNSAVSGLLPTISNSGNNRILTSDGTSYGIIAESGLSYDSITSNLAVIYDTNNGNTGNSAMLKLDAYDNSSNASVGARVQLSRYRGTQSSPSGVSANDTLSVIRTNTVDASGINRIVARILTQADGEPSGLNLYTPSRMTFNTSSGPNQLDNSLILYSDGKLYSNGYLQIFQTNNRLDPTFNGGKESALSVYATPSGLLGGSSDNIIYNIAGNLSPISPNSNHTMYYYGNVAGVYSELPSGVANSGAIFGSVFGAWRNSRGSNVGGPWYDDNGDLSTLYGTLIQYGNSIGQSGIGGPASTGVNPHTENAYGLYISPQKGYGIIDNAYDLYIANTNYNTGTINNHYSIYQASTNANYLAGSLIIDNGLSAPTNVYNHAGSLSGNIAINYAIDRQIQYFSINGTTNFTKGTGWTTGTKSVDIVVAITVFATTTIAFDSNFVIEWYNPLPIFTANTTINGISAGRYLVLLRSIGNYVQGHYIGNVTNSY